ncbi:Heat Labile Enterotoxin Type Iib [Beauveria brongniartii RCEF 3172]|uniref:Heat Labile Enterotoxin Type Iib n=1 Tax=Beauveria brongniartii RCEF 3172 TaxID=1081107 RepID=A0A167GY70_9HYPO|nr:Heat Labile Enterotoxin Type Iib [Beauveria brongniartii RCEF 3172]
MKFSNVFLAFIGLACAAPTETQNNAPKKPVKLARSDKIVFPDSTGQDSETDNPEPITTQPTPLPRPLGPNGKLSWLEPSPESVQCRSSKTEQICGSKLFCGLYERKDLRPDDRFPSPKECLAAREPAPLPKVVYRGELTAPETFRKLGGIPTEFDGPTTDKSYSLEVHHKGRGEVHSAYTSTTSSFGVAFGYSLRNNAGDGWVYKIHPTPNMIDMDASDFPLFHSAEDELSALGGVRWDQVEAWMAIPHDIIGTRITEKVVHRFRKEEAFIAKFPNMKWIKNEDYNPRYDQFTISGGQPQLAGNAPNLDKYKEKTLEQWATEFMNKNGEAVGWTGAFPLNLKAPVGKEPKPATSEGGQGTPEEKQPAAPKSQQQCAEIGKQAFFECKQKSGELNECYKQSIQAFKKCSGQ